MGQGRYIRGYIPRKSQLKLKARHEYSVSQLAFKFIYILLIYTNPGYRGGDRKRFSLPHLDHYQRQFTQAPHRRPVPPPSSPALGSQRLLHHLQTLRRDKVHGHLDAAAQVAHLGEDAGGGEGREH